MKANSSTTIISLLDTNKREDRQSQHFHASQLRECGRKQVLSLLGHVEINKPAKPEWQRAADFGNEIHDYITALCKRQEILEEAEQPLEVNEEYFVSGRVDAILCRNGHRRVLEIKTMSHSKYVLFQPGDDKFEDAYAQLQWYLWSLRLEGGFILAVNRDNCAWKEFSILYDDQYVLFLLSRMNRLKNYLNNKTLPVPERSKRCFFCGFKETDLCRKAIEGEKGIEER